MQKQWGVRARRRVGGKPRRIIDLPDGHTIAAGSVAELGQAFDVFVRLRMHGSPEFQLHECASEEAADALRAKIREAMQ